MGLILTATFGLIIWLVLWSLAIASGFDAILIGIAIFLVAIGVWNLLPYLPGRRG